MLHLPSCKRCPCLPRGLNRSRLLRSMVPMLGSGRPQDCLRSAKQQQIRMAYLLSVSFLHFRQPQLHTSAWACQSAARPHTLATVCAAKLLHNCAIRIRSLCKPAVCIRAHDPGPPQTCTGCVWERVCRPAGTVVLQPWRFLPLLYSCLHKAPHASMCATDIVCH